MNDVSVSNPLNLLMLSLLALTALAIVMCGIAIVFHVRRQRLPDATRYEHIRELRAQEEAILDRRREELSIVEQKILERDRLIAGVSALQEQLNALQAELAQLAPARAEIEDVKRDAANVAGELAELMQKRDSIRTDFETMTKGLEEGRKEASAIGQEIEKRRSEIAELREEQARCASDLEPLRAERDVALRVLKEAEAIEARKAALELELSRLNGELVRATENDAKAKLAAADVAQKQARVLDLEGEVAHLLARKALLENETGNKPSQAEDDELLNDLARRPGCLEAPRTLRGRSRTEKEALTDVFGYLKQLGLKYHWRAVYGFHTSLKINDKAQITILAGVSGTGKSLLPRRYAEAVGIHFLQIAVEPRWDSPQDLLGFYNYIEKRYRATDLARLIVHMDPYDTAHLNKSDSRGHVSLVLLDEMNLARVEYYFSEFLSRIEARPPFAEADQERKRMDSLIPVDIRGASRQIALFPAHNVLFAGTMNDDESTQALSDKVIDRGNILQFGAPKSFMSADALGQAAPATEAQRFDEWRKWVRPESTLAGLSREKADTTVARLAEIMQGCGRPFGHRLRDAMFAYVANYPTDGPAGSDVSVPLADQIEFRILPKLRGIDIDSHRSSLDDLAKLLRQELNDPDFAQRIEDLLNEQSRGAGLFNWRGLTRQA